MEIKYRGSRRKSKHYQRDAMAWCVISAACASLPVFDAGRSSCVAQNGVGIDIKWHHFHPEICLLIRQGIDSGHAHQNDEHQPGTDALALNWRCLRAAAGFENVVIVLQCAIRGLPGRALARMKLSIFPGVIVI